MLASGFVAVILPPPCAGDRLLLCLDKGRRFRFSVSVLPAHGGKNHLLVFLKIERLAKPSDLLRVFLRHVFVYGVASERCDIQVGAVVRPKLESVLAVRNQPEQIHHAGIVRLQGFIDFASDGRRLLEGRADVGDRHPRPDKLFHALFPDCAKRFGRAAASRYVAVLIPRHRTNKNALDQGQVKFRLLPVVEVQQEIREPSNEIHQEYPSLAQTFILRRFLLHLSDPSGSRRPNHAGSSGAHRFPPIRPLSGLSASSVFLRRVPFRRRSPLSCSAFRASSIILSASFCGVLRTSPRYL